MNPALRRSAAHVFVESLDRPLLDDVDAHHLLGVLRLRTGQSVSVSDGRGAWRICRLEVGEGGRGDLAPVTEVMMEPAGTPPITIGFALPKADRPEWIVQKLTEIGVDRILMLITARGVARWHGDRADRRLAKMCAVAREASMQCRRVLLPSVEGPLALGDVVTGESTALAEPGGRPLSLSAPTVLIGPEGGWTETELIAEQHHVDLGATVLRVETAAVTAAALLVAMRRNGLVTSSAPVSGMADC